ncbi:putative reverse transcriptase domain-containing protein [Tanacetum coccineum]
MMGSMLPMHQLQEEWPSAQDYRMWSSEANFQKGIATRLKITTVENQARKTVEQSQGLMLWALQVDKTRTLMSLRFFLMDIIPTTLDHGHDVELADGKIIWVNTLIRGCTLNFLNHPFNIDLMPVEIGSFDIIIGMDWLSKYHVVIVCDEKIVRIPFGNEILIVRGDGSNNEHGSRLNIISCTKTQKYLLRGCHVFLAHVTAKKGEDKSEEKRLEDIPIDLRFSPKVFTEDLSGILPTRQWKSN